MTEERWTEQTEKLARVASSDPGSVTSRGWYPAEDDPDREPEALHRWQARAILLRLAEAGLLVASGWHPDPEGSAQLTTYRDGWQYAVATPNTDEPLVYGDQYWVSSGRALVDSHPHGRIVRRKVAAYAGPWREVTS